MAGGRSRRFRPRQAGVDAIHLRHEARLAERNADADAKSAETRLKERELLLKERELNHSLWRNVLQAIGAVVILVGAYTAWQQFLDARYYSQQQLLEAQSGQITERFSRAVEQLGNTDAVDVRIGGIFALERIARDSERDRLTVAEVLTAFVVRSSISPPRAVGSESLSSKPLPSEHISEAPSGRGPPFERLPDFRAAITVLARMYPPGEETPFDLENADLRSAHIRRANLSAANLSYADLSDAIVSQAALRRAFLLRADLSGANLYQSRLSDAILFRADLSNASLGYADLRDADLRDADLRYATLYGADLSDATLSGADLRGADLADADLRWAHLRGADLRGTCAARTLWPAGFDPTAAGVTENC